MPHMIEFPVTCIPGAVIIWTGHEHLIRWPNGEVHTMQTTPVRTPADNELLHSIGEQRRYIHRNPLS